MIGQNERRFKLQAIKIGLVGYRVTNVFGMIIGVSALAACGVHFYILAVRAKHPPPADLRRENPAGGHLHHRQVRVLRPYKRPPAGNAPSVRGSPACAL